MIGVCFWEKVHFYFCVNLIFPGKKIIPFQMAKKR